MKNNRFILDLFIGEMRSNTNVLTSAFEKSSDCLVLENVARSLKSSAKLVGFAELSNLFEKLEALFASKMLLSKKDANAVSAVEIFQKLATFNSDEFAKNLEQFSAQINKIVAEGFSGEKSLSAKTDSSDDGDFERIEIEPSMKELFVLDVSTQVERISNTLIELENDFSSTAKLEVLMRASHSIKGAARAVGIDSIVELTHQMEDCFSAALKGKIFITEQSVDVFFLCADFILKLCAESFAKINISEKNRLVSLLRSVEQAKLTSESINEKSKSDVLLQNFEDKTDKSYVRISTENINSIMALVAENLIENRKLDDYKAELSLAKQEYDVVLNKLEESINILNSSETSSILPRLEKISSALREQVAVLRSTIDGFGEYAQKNVLLSTNLYKEVLGSRMRPFSDLAQRFPKMVRAFSKSVEKKVSFEISGASVPIDRDILEKLDAPVMHILRNACDHGIELPQERVEVGKKSSGKIVMKASHSSGMFLLSITDDGRGIDVEKVKEKILARNLVSAEILSQMQEDEIFEFLFLPSFTTKETVSEISGRGVGLDVVQTMLREVGGSVSVASEIGKGSTFTLKLPITRSVLKSLLVSINSQPYAFALSSVSRTLRIKNTEIKTDKNGRYFVSEKKRINFVDSAKVLGFGESVFTNEYLYVVVVAGRGKFWGFVVDDIPSETELAVRSLNTSLGKIPCVSAAALSPDGLPILILEIDDLLIYATRMQNQKSMPVAMLKKSEEKKKRILVVDDSPTVRATQRKILENAGFEVDTAFDGVDGWNLVRLANYDIVVSDIDMPRMTGFELTAKIRKIYKKLPIVIVSYKDRPEDAQKGKEVGANAYLTKSSFQDDTLISTIKKLL